MNEGDIVIVFSQFGEIVDCRLLRNKKTGRSKGFAFVSYEDQRSTIVAVDNLNGAMICNRIIKVDHVEKFKIPREYLNLDTEDSIYNVELYKPTGPDGLGWGEFRQESELELKITYPEKYNHDSIPNEIEWEQKFIKIVNKEQDKLIANSKKLSKVKREKKERMNKRKEKAVKDSERRKQEHANKLKDIYLSYGIYKIEKSSENVQDIIMPSKKLKEKEEEI